MNEPYMYPLSLVVGALFGFAYYAVLWITVKRMQSASRPAVFMLAGTAGRLLVCFTVFFGFFQFAGWINLIFMGTGFFISRIISVRYVRRSKPDDITIKETGGGTLV